MKNKKILFIIIAVIAALVVIYIIGIATGAATIPGDEAAEQPPVEEDNTDESLKDNTEETSKVYGWDPASGTTEENTTARVDEIQGKALDDAENISEEDAVTLMEDALEYIAANVDNFYISNEVMEKALYYGSWIYFYIEHESPAETYDELPDDIAAWWDIGWNTAKAIKYVYRGTESIEDLTTQNALETIKKYL